MIAEQKIYGYIFLPGSDEKIENVWLTMTENEMFFECAFSIYSNLSWPIVCGVFNGMGKVTFVDVFSSGGQQGRGGSYRKFIVNWVLKNEHFNSISEVKFKSIAFREEALMDWSREQLSLGSEILKYTVPEPSYPLIKELQLFKLSWQLAYLVESGRKEVVLNQISSLNSEFNEDISWVQIVDHILKVKKLIIFITNKNPRLSNFFLDDRVELFFVQPKLNDAKFPSNLDLEYRVTKSHLPKFIEMWFEDSRLEPITDLILEKHFNFDTPPHRHFFNLAVGLESFHREFISEDVALHDVTSILNRDKIKELIEDPELKQWFRDKSNFWKKPTLKDRLFDLQETIERVSVGIFNLGVEELITKIKQTRDDIAHAGIFYKRFGSRIELMIVTKIVEFTLRIEVYKKIGLNLEVDMHEIYNEANQLCKVLARLNDFEIAEKKLPS